mgnify:CR=1 FL=1
MCIRDRRALLPVLTVTYLLHGQEAAALRLNGSLPRHMWGGGLNRAELAFVDGEVRRHLVSPLALCVSAIPNHC